MHQGCSSSRSTQKLRTLARAGVRARAPPAGKGRSTARYPGQECVGLNFMLNTADTAIKLVRAHPWVRSNQLAIYLLPTPVLGN